jgi:hypothetical protein
MKIIVLSKHDFSGSAWRIVEAVRKHTELSPIHIVKNRHRFGYPTDYVLSSPNRRIVKELLKEADIVHFKGSELPIRQWLGMKISPKAKIIITVAGSGFRRLSPENPNPSPIARSWFSFKQYIELTNFRTAMTPDLNYPEFKSVFIPQLIDSENVPNCWIPPNGKFVIGYYPAINRKGFESHMSPVFTRLEKEGYKFEKVPTVNMSHRQSVEVKKRMTVFIDQIAATGCYGSSAIEAMQFGVPVIAYISEEAKQRSQSEEFKISPVLNPGYNVEGLYFLLKQILDGKIDLQPISIQTKQYCNNFHGYSQGAKTWGEIYKKVLD